MQMSLFGSLWGPSHDREWGRPDPALLTTGLIGRGIITTVEQTRVTTGSDQTDNFDVVCDITAEVTLPGRAPFAAQLRQAIRVSELTAMVPGHTDVIVRVDPDDNSRVAIDYELTITHELAIPPGVSGPRVIRTRSVTIASGMTINRRAPAQPQVNSAAEVLASGRPVRVAMLQCEHYPVMKSAEGLDMYLFVLLVFSDGQPPYGVQVGNPVPPAAFRLLDPWRNVPARMLPAEPGRVVIDWAAALAELEQVGAG
jgi:hypothetical protein